MLKYEISSLTLKLPGDLNELHSNENREFIRAFLETARWRYYPKISLEVGGNCLLPSPYAYYVSSHFFMIFGQKIGLEDPAFVSLVEQIEQLEKALLEHPLHKVCDLSHECLAIFCVDMWLLHIF